MKLLKSIFSVPNTHKLGVVLVTMLLSLAASTSNIAHTKKKVIEYTPPKGKNQHPSQTRKAGGTREDICNISPENTVTLLVPQNHIPTTISANPTFFWHLPKEEITYPMRFTLIESGGKTIFTKSLHYSSPGVHSLKLPINNSLKIDKTYRWTITIICSTNKPSRNSYASALIRRLPEATIDSTDKTTSYKLAKKGIWYDALLHSYLQARQESEFYNLIKQINLDSLLHNRVNITLPKDQEMPDLSPNS